MTEKVKKLLAVCALPVVLGVSGLLIGALVWILKSLSKDALEAPILFFTILGFSIGCLITSSRSLS